MLPTVPPEISIARFAMTSFEFMLVWVPEPVCQILSGKCSSSEPDITSSQALEIREPMSESRAPRLTLVCAAACLRIPKARMIERGIVSSPISKLISDLAV